MPARSSVWRGSAGGGARKSGARAGGGGVPTSGEIRIDGERVVVRSPRSAIAAGIALITEDRKAQGLVLGMTVRENTTLAHLAQFERGIFIDKPAELSAANAEIAELRIRTPSPEQLVRNLSGGNQQKVVLAKWLIGHARVFLFDE